MRRSPLSSSIAVLPSLHRPLGRAKARQPTKNRQWSRPKSNAKSSDSSPKRCGCSSISGTFRLLRISTAPSSPRANRPDPSSGGGGNNNSHRGRMALPPRTRRRNRRLETGWGCPGGGIISRGCRLWLYDYNNKSREAAEEEERAGQHRGLARELRRRKRERCCEVLKSCWRERGNTPAGQVHRGGGRIRLRRIDRRLRRRTSWRLPRGGWAPSSNSSGQRRCRAPRNQSSPRLDEPASEGWGKRWGHGYTTSRGRNVNAATRWSRWRCSSRGWQGSRRRSKGSRGRRGEEKEGEPVDAALAGLAMGP